jgi:hypothetical protein
MKTFTSIIEFERANVLTETVCSFRLHNGETVTVTTFGTLGLIDITSPSNYITNLYR